MVKRKMTIKPKKPIRRTKTKALNVLDITGVITFIKSFYNDVLFLRKRVENLETIIADQGILLKKINKTLWPVKLKKVTKTAKVKTDRRKKIKR